MRKLSALALVTMLAAAMPVAIAPAMAQDAPAAPADPAAPAEPAAPAAPAAPADAAPAPAAAVDPDSIGPTVGRDLWCAVALSLASRSAEMRSDANAATSDAEASQVLFSSVVFAMQANGNTEEQFNELSTRYTEMLLDPFAPAETRLSREECDAAVPEAQAKVDAAAAARKANEGAAPASPAADAPAAPSDAPAAPADAPAAPAAQ